MVQQAESGRAATLLGMEYGALQGAREGMMQAQANQMSAYALEQERIAANKGMWGSIIGGVLGAGGAMGAAKIGLGGGK